MDISIIFTMVDDIYIQKYRKELENDENEIYVKKVQESYSALEKALNDEQMKLVKSHLNYKMLLEEHIDILTGTITMNYGIKIGMQLKEQLEDID